jgi:hypothetical protein
MRCVQFHIPRRAADAVDFPALRKHARELGIEHPSIEYNSYRTRPGQTLITTAGPMAVLLADALRAIGVDAGQHGKTELVIACANGVAAAFKAIDDEFARPMDEQRSRR